MRIIDWSSDVCSSDLLRVPLAVSGADRTKRVEIAAAVAPRNAVERVGVAGAGAIDVVRGVRHGGRICAGAGVGNARAKDPARSCAVLPLSSPRTLRKERGPEFRSEEHTSELQSLMRISYA